MSGSVTGHASIVEVDDACSAFEMFDAVCRRELRIGGTEFLRRWEAGEYSNIDSDEVEGLPEVIAALGLAR